MSSSTKIEVGVPAFLVDEADVEVFDPGGQVPVDDAAQRDDGVDTRWQLVQGGGAADPNLVVVGMPDRCADLPPRAIGDVEVLGLASIDDLGGELDQPRVVRPGQPCSTSRQCEGTADAP